MLQIFYMYIFLKLVTYKVCWRTKHQQICKLLTRRKQLHMSDCNFTKVMQNMVELNSVSELRALQYYLSNVAKTQINKSVSLENS